MQELIKAVRKHAEANYNEGGWDFLVECWEDSDIAELLSEDDTVQTAIVKCERVVGAMDEQRREVQSFIW